MQKTDLTYAIIVVNFHEVHYAGYSSSNGGKLREELVEKRYRKNGELASNQDEWLKDMRGNLSLAATIITTITFQTAINPPGGVTPATESGELKCLENLENNPCPGESVLAIVRQ